MPAYSSPAEHPRSGRFFGLLVNLGIATCLFAGLALALRDQSADDSILPPNAAVAPTDLATMRSGEVRIAEMVQALQLVTIEVHGTATAEICSQNWRGAGRARVTAPVRYLYGVELSGLTESDVQLGAVLDRVVITVPPPQRLAVEVDVTSPVEAVDVTGLRLRSRVGEHLLGQARLAVHAEARRADLTPEQVAAVTAQSAQRIAELVTKLLGGNRLVDVQFTSAQGMSVGVQVARRAP